MRKEIYTEAGTPATRTAAALGWITPTGDGARVFVVVHAPRGADPTGASAWIARPPRREVVR